MKKNRNYLGRNFSKIRTPDKISVKKRSEVMSKVCSKNTKLEARFTDLLEFNNIKGYETYSKDLPGKPDVVFRCQRIAIFIDSDFWHGWQYPRWKQTLKNDFWREKIEKNRKRDVLNKSRLIRLGWRVFRIWEHQLKNHPEKIINQVTSALQSDSDKIRR